MTPQKPIFSEILRWLSPKISLSHLVGGVEQQPEGICVNVDLCRCVDNILVRYHLFSFSFPSYHPALSLCGEKTKS